MIGELGRAAKRFDFPKLPMPFLGELRFASANGRSIGFGGALLSCSSEEPGGSFGWLGAEEFCISTVDAAAPMLRIDGATKARDSGVDGPESGRASGVGLGLSELTEGGNEAEELA